MTSATPEGLGDYLSQGLGDRVTIVSCKRSFPGASRETWLIAAEVGGRPAGFALRIDAKGGQAIPFPLVREYKVYRALHGSAVPVAEPLWFAENIDFAEGRPHMVRRLVDGSTAVPGLESDTAEGRARCRAAAMEVLEKLAIVHTIDWAALGLGDVLEVPPETGSALGFEFDSWIDFWDARKPAPDPLIEETICWLREQVPNDTPRISLLKGNSGVGEEIWRDGRIVAMSDWELASLGDAAGDLQFSEGTFQLGDFNELLEYYEQCAGISMSEERLAFGAFLVWFKAFVSMRGYMLRCHIDNGDPRLTNLSFGELYSERTRRRLISCIGRDIVSAWHDMKTHEEPLYATFRGKMR